MPASLLLDENLSAAVAVTLRTEDGIDAVHVRDRDMLGADDARILERAFAEDRIVVTANVEDFVSLARRRELHAGMILIEDGALHRDEQLAVVRAAISVIAGQDMVNRALWVNLDGSLELDEIPRD